MPWTPPRASGFAGGPPLAPPQARRVPNLGMAPRPGMAPRGGALGPRNLVPFSF